MEEKISSLIELGISVEGTEKECHDRESNCNSAYGSKLKSCYSLGIFSKKDKDQLDKRYDPAEDICKYGIVFKIADTGCLESTITGSAREHQTDPCNRKDNNHKVKNDLNFRIVFRVHKGIIAFECKR